MHFASLSTTNAQLEMNERKTGSSNRGDEHVIIGSSCMADDRVDSNPTEFPHSPMRSSQ